MPSEELSKLSKRLKEIRSYRKMSQQEFAKSINLGQSTWAMIEIQKRELLDRHIQLICTTHGINEHWLRTGEGEMVADIAEEDEYFKAATQLSKTEDKLAMQAIIEYWKLDNTSKVALRSFIYRLVEKSKE